MQKLLSASFAAALLVCSFNSHAESQKIEKDEALTIISKGRVVGFGAFGLRLTHSVIYQERLYVCSATGNEFYCQQPQ